MLYAILVYNPFFSYFNRIYSAVLSLLIEIHSTINISRIHNRHKTSLLNSDFYSTTTIGII